MLLNVSTFKGAALTSTFFQQCFMQQGSISRNSKKRSSQRSIQTSAMRDAYNLTSPFKQPLCRFVEHTIESWVEGNEKQLKQLDQEVQDVFVEWSREAAERHGTLSFSVYKEIVMSERTMHEYLQSLLLLGYVFHKFYVRQKLKRSTFKKEEIEKLNRYIDQLEAKVPVAANTKVIVQSSTGTSEEVEYKKVIQRYISSARHVAEQWRLEGSGKWLFEAFKQLDEEAFMFYMPKKENVEVYHAMDQYKSCTLGTQVTLNNFNHDSMMEVRSMSMRDYQVLSERTILMGYLLREQEVKMEGRMVPM